MRSIFTLIASTSCALVLTSASLATEMPESLTHPISLVELNGSWFGINGDPNNSLGSETRVDTWRKFLQNNALLSDVMVFEEIVDLDLLQNSVLDNQYKCQSYTRPNPKYQHVVICVKPEYRFDIAEGSTSYVIEQVDVNGALRPAVHGILKTQDGTRIAHLFGVHLKANGDKSAVRLQQTQIIANYIKSEKIHDPVIIMGDFNTFGTDPADMENQFKVDGLIELNTPEPYTWASVHENFPAAKLDRVWISNTLAPRVLSAHVVGPCNSTDRAQLTTYNDTVSDHCPTKVVIAP